MARMRRTLTKGEKKYLSRRVCAWCEHRLDWDSCGAIYEQCSATLRAKRIVECLKNYKPRARR